MLVAIPYLTFVEPPQAAHNPRNQAAPLKERTVTPLVTGVAADNAVLFGIASDGID
jgi:hypothetical protein